MTMKITVMGAVVKDLSHTMQRLWEMFGMGPWKIREVTGQNTSFCRSENRKHEEEKDFSFRSAVCRTDKVFFELIEPQGPDSPYAAFLKRKGEGLHHIVFSFDTEAEAETFLEDLQAKGLQILAEFSAPDGNFRRVCLDTWTVLGFNLEIRMGDEETLTDQYYPSADAVPDFPVRQYIRQMGIVVEDTQKMIRNFEYYLGLDGWTTVSFNEGNLDDFLISGTLYTAKYEFLCSVKWVGEVELELVEPLSGPLIYFDFLHRRGPGFNHVKTVMPDAEISALMQHLEPFGVRDIQSGRMGDNHHYNLNTEDRVGFILELGNGGKSIASR